MTTVETFYTPARVAALLKQLPVFYDLVRLETGDLGVRIKTGRPERNRLENRMAMMADLLSAIEALGYFEELVILDCVVGGTPYREFAQRHQVSIGHVSDTKREAVRAIAYYLGWREPKRERHEQTEGWPMETTTERLRAALQYAVTVIESYQMDIRDSAWTGVDLVAIGFCQGSIYRDAVSVISRMVAEAEAA